MHTNNGGIHNGFLNASNSIPPLPIALPHTGIGKYVYLNFGQTNTICLAFLVFMAEHQYAILCTLCSILCNSTLFTLLALLLCVPSLYFIVFCLMSSLGLLLLYSPTATVEHSRAVYGPAFPERKDPKIPQNTTKTPKYPAVLNDYLCNNLYIYIYI